MLRILSDLHLFDAATQVRDLRQLEPLLADVHTLVINGDSCELLHGHNAGRLPAMQRFFRERVPEVIFVTGNHDPAISEVHELLLADGRVWVTHGDICFDDLTPWSRNQPELVALVRAELAREPAGDYRAIPVRLRVARTVAGQLEEKVDRLDRSLRARLLWLWHTFLPPRQPIAMLRAWRELQPPHRRQNATTSLVPVTPATTMECMSRDCDATRTTSGTPRHGVLALVSSVRHVRRHARQRKPHSPLTASARPHAH